MLATNARQPHASPDGRWIVFSAPTPDRFRLFYTTLDGSPRPVSNSVAPGISRILCFHRTAGSWPTLRTNRDETEIFLVRFPEGEDKWQI